MPRQKPDSLRTLRVVPSEKTAAPVAPLEIPDEPCWTTLLGRNQTAKLAAAEWKRTVPKLYSLGVLASLDRRVLMDYCVCCAQIDVANKEIATNGASSDGERGVQKNPAVTQVNQCRTHLKGYIAALGLSPASRVSLALRGSDDDDDLGID